MTTNDWKREMDHMLEMFDRQATLSLRKINGYFETLRRPFNEEFRQYFLKISNQRLDTSYTKIDFESWDKQQEVDLVGHRDDSSHGHENSSSTAPIEQKPTVDSKDNVVGLLDCVVVDSLPAPKQETTENASDLIEILDSGDEDEMVKAKLHESMAQYHNGTNKTTPSAPLKNDSGCRGTETRRTETNGSSAGNSSAGAGTSHDNQFNKAAQTSSSSTTIKRSKLSGGKRFKCNQCPRSFHYKCQLNRHCNQVHIRAKSLGVGQDDNGLYSCTHCSHQFLKFKNLTMHMTRCHKDGQYLFYCTHCVKPFTQENEKNAHESRCQRSHYECYLCKSLDTPNKSQIKDHMRQHTGIQCAVCNKLFRLRRQLEHHLDDVHGKNIK